MNGPDVSRIERHDRLLPRSTTMNSPPACTFRLFQIVSTLPSQHAGDAFGIRTRLDRSDWQRQVAVSGDRPGVEGQSENLELAVCRHELTTLPLDERAPSIDLFTPVEDGNERSLRRQPVQDIAVVQAKRDRQQTVMRRRVTAVAVDHRPAVRDAAELRRRVEPALAERQFDHRTGEIARWSAAIGVAAATRVMAGQLSAITAAAHTAVSESFERAG